ncbi:MAG TPA: hypothetical protein VMD30_12065 [Tepidisphaeraceae bacterium]|nr:hypothetical protein [Tepidisphaeraceae bacterium]
MGLILGLKRSYKCFLPSFLFDPRRPVRQLFVPILFYIIGWSTGSFTYAGIAGHEHVFKVSIIALAVLLVLKWWAGGVQPGDWSFQKEDGTWQRCSQ